MIIDGREYLPLVPRHIRFHVHEIVVTGVEICTTEIIGEIFSDHEDQEEFVHTDHPENPNVRRYYYGKTRVLADWGVITYDAHGSVIERLTGSEDWSEVMRLYFAEENASCYDTWHVAHKDDIACVIEHCLKTFIGEMMIKGKNDEQSLFEASPCSAFGSTRRPRGKAAHSL